MKIICVEEHAIDAATDKAARPAVLDEHVWVTLSGLFGLPHFQFIHTVIGADRIVWSVDYPYLTPDRTREFLGKLPISEQNREKIAHVNAEKLFTL
jgi:uncharacterized protein